MILKIIKKKKDLIEINKAQHTRTHKINAYTSRKLEHKIFNKPI